MRARVYGFWAVALIAGMLTGCGMTAGGFNSSAGQAGGVLTDAAPLDTSAIQTQTLGPAPSGSAPATGRVIGAPLPQSGAAPSAAAQNTASTTGSNAAADSSQPLSPAEIGAAAAAALQGGTSTATTNAISPEEAACVQQGGRWSPAGNTSAMACIRPAKDAGKSCNVESDCTTQCLAQSRSCAPFWPIFGCTEVIQNNGAVVRLCLE